MSDYSSAVEDFHRARNRADLKTILARLRGESNDLLSFDEVRKQLKLKGSSERGLRDIPLDDIVGSVGRYTDFTRDFLPRAKSDAERWARVKLATADLAGLPPIDVYQIGSVYFVRDGNHRVSVARQLGATHIQAYVTEIRTRVQIDPNVKPEDLIVKAEYADFLEKTSLDELRPDADLSTTVFGQYPYLEEHIDVHRYFMGIDFQRDVSYEEAVTHWYDTVYLPVIRMIRERNLLRSFPDRTETDLYIWMAEHQAALEEAVGWHIRADAAAKDLVSQFGPRPFRTLARLSEKVLESISLDRLEPGPPPGEWRKEKEIEIRGPEMRLFAEILVAISGEESGWSALEQAFIIARRESGMVHGLHVVSSEDELDHERTFEIQAEFNRRCTHHELPGQISFSVGDISRQICSRGRWADVILTRLNYPPPNQALARLSHGFREMIERCPSPVFAVPQSPTGLNHALLAYDGSPKAEEALYVATYLAGKWKTHITVVTVEDKTNVTQDILARARQYLQDHNIQAKYRLETGPAAQRILELSDTENCDFLIMGGYGYNPVVEVVLGSVVDQVSRQTTLPMLVCR